MPLCPTWPPAARHGVHVLLHSGGQILLDSF